MASQDVVSVDGVQVYDRVKHRAGRVTGPSSSLEGTTAERKDTI